MLTVLMRKIEMGENGIKSILFKRETGGLFQKSPFETIYQ